MFLGGSILSFVLPMAAFIVIAGGLFWLYRRPHRNPQLTYLEPETVTAVGFADGREMAGVLRELTRSLAT